MLHLLAEFRFGRYTSASWAEMRRAHQLPALRKELKKTEEALQEWAGHHARPFSSVFGAFLPLPELVQQLLEIYIFYDALLLESGPLRLKLSYDKRYVLGHGNIGFSVSFCDVVSPHNSKAHCHTFAIAEAEESAQDLAALFAELDLNATLAVLQQMRFQVGEERQEFTLQVVLTLDWMSMLPMLSYARPATRNPEDKICGFCACSKGFLAAAWRADPFAFSNIIDHPTDLLPALSVNDCRYCPMHGCTRLLCSALQRLRQAAPHGARGQMDALLDPIRHGWTVDTTLRCVEMKRIIGDEALLQRIAALFPGDLLEIPTSSGGWQVLTMDEAVYMLLDSIRVFKEYAYRPVPHQDDLSTLWSARDAYLGVACALEWSLTPAAHYMTNHFLTFARHDKTAYFALQEGPEHHHHDERLEIATTMGRGVAHNTDMRSGYQQLLDQQAVRRILVRLHYGTPATHPQPFVPGAADPAALPIARARHSQ